MQRVPSGRWSAKIDKKGFKRIRIGTYDSDVQAACAYDRMARSLHGTNAILNFPHLRTDDNSFPATKSTLPIETSPLKGVASGPAFANIPGEQPALESVGSVVRTTGSQIGSSGSTKRTLDETPVAAEVRFPIEISADSTLLDANTDAKPQILKNVASEDFGISDEFLNNLWS